jgi:hypothetical protein
VHPARSERRTKANRTRVIYDLVDLRYPGADRIVLVLDILNTHTPGSHYEAFPPAEARRIIDRLETHYTPKRGTASAGRSTGGCPLTMPA